MYQKDVLVMEDDSQNESQETEEKFSSTCAERNDMLKIHMRKPYELFMRFSYPGEGCINYLRFMTYPVQKNEEERYVGSLIIHNIALRKAEVLSIDKVAVVKPDSIEFGVYDFAIEVFMGFETHIILACLYPLLGDQGGVSLVTGTIISNYRMLAGKDLEHEKGTCIGKASGLIICNR